MPRLRNGSKGDSNPGSESPAEPPCSDAPDNKPLLIWPR